MLRQQTLRTFLLRPTGDKTNFTADRGTIIKAPHKAQTNIFHSKLFYSKAPQNAEHVIIVQGPFHCVNDSSRDANIRFKFIRSGPGADATVSTPPTHPETFLLLQMTLRFFAVTCFTLKLFKLETMAWQPFHCVNDSSCDANIKFECK